MRNLFYFISYSVIILISSDCREGHSSMIVEVAEDLHTKPDLVIASVGGGGLFIGVCEGKINIIF